MVFSIKSTYIPILGINVVKFYIAPGINPYFTRVYPRFFGLYFLAKPWYNKNMILNGLSIGTKGGYYYENYHQMFHAYGSHRRRRCRCSIPTSGAQFHLCAGIRHRGYLVLIQTGITPALFWGGCFILITELCNLLFNYFLDSPKAARSAIFPSSRAGGVLPVPAAYTGGFTRKRYSCSLAHASSADAMSRSASLL